MSFFANFPLFSIVLSLIFAVVSSVLPGKAARILTVVLNVLAAGMSACVLLLVLSTGAPVTYQMGHFPHPWGNEIRMSILEPLLSLLFSVVMLITVVGGKKQLSADLQPARENLYYVMTDLLQAALLVLAYTNDIFTGYVFIEICTLSSCGILMVRNIGRTTLASIRYMIFSLIGSGLFLLGVIILYNITGHLLMPNLKESIAVIFGTGDYKVPLLSAMTLITVGLGVKSGLFPFHFWMPDTYGAATPASSGILSGIVSKGYIFLLIKIVFDVFGVDVFYASGVSKVLYLFGCAGIVAGSVSAIHAAALSEMLAYSSAAQIGYIYLGIGISPTLGMLAAVFHIMTHALTKPALFLSGANLSARVGGSFRFRDLQGTAHEDQVAGVGFLLGACSMIGVPLTMGFMSKCLFALAAFRAESRTILILTLLVLAVSTVLNTVYFARTLIRIFNRTERKLTHRAKIRENLPYFFAALVFGGVNIFLGVSAEPLIRLIEKGLTLL